MQDVDAVGLRNSNVAGYYWLDLVLKETDDEGVAGNADHHQDRDREKAAQNRLVAVAALVQYGDGLAE